MIPTGREVKLFKLGLTGSIATGKSTVLAMFTELGCKKFSADDAVHELYQGRAIPAVENICPEAVQVTGKNQKTIDRSILAQSLQNNPGKLEKLEEIIHPLVQLEYQNFIKQIQHDSGVVVVDVPLLFESQQNYDLNAIAVTHCTTAEQKRRALLRPNMTEQKLQFILARQMDQEEKKSRADYLIDTNGSIKNTRQQVVDIVELCLASRHLSLDNAH